MLIAITILLLIIISLLFVPIVIHIDTVHELFIVKVRGICSFQMDQTENELYFVFNVPFYRKEIHPFRYSGNKKKVEKPDVEKSPKAIKRKKKSRMTFDRFLSLIRSFRVRKFYCTLDSGDFVRNAMLVPVFQVFSRYRNNLTVNFTGDFQLQLYASNNLWRLGRAYLKI